MMSAKGLWRCLKVGIIFVHVPTLLFKQTSQVLDDTRVKACLHL